MIRHQSRIESGEQFRSFFIYSAFLRQTFLVFILFYLFLSLPWLLGGSKWQPPIHNSRIQAQNTRNLVSVQVKFSIILQRSLSCRLCIAKIASSSVNIQLSRTSDSTLCHSSIWTLHSWWPLPKPLVLDKFTALFLIISEWVCSLHIKTQTLNLQAEMSG